MTGCLSKSALIGVWGTNHDFQGCAKVVAPPCLSGVWLWSMMVGINEGAVVWLFVSTVALKVQFEAAVFEQKTGNAREVKLVVLKTGTGGQLGSLFSPSPRLYTCSNTASNNVTEPDHQLRPAPPHSQRPVEQVTG